MEAIQFKRAELEDQEIIAHYFVTSYQQKL